MEVENMSYLRAKMFNRRASGKKSMPNKILNVLDLHQGQVAVDIGAGGGYFVMKFVEKVGPNGKVFAVDTNQNFLEYILENSTMNGYRNIKTIFADHMFDKLPSNELDLVFIRNVYHHLQDRVNYFKNLKKMLKPHGRVVIIDYMNNGSFSFHKIFGHSVPQEQIIEELEKAGFQLAKSYDFLPEESFTIFIKR